MTNSASPAAIQHPDAAIPLILVTQDHLISTARALIVERCLAIGPSNTNPALTPTWDEVGRILEVERDIHLLDRFLSGALGVDWMRDRHLHPLSIEIARHKAHLSALVERTRPATEA